MFPDARSLLSGTDLSQQYQINVVKPFNGFSGTAAPWNGSLGGGPQCNSVVSINTLREHGFFTIVKITLP